MNKQYIALYTIVRRELVRMFRIFSQVFLPPIITTTLYFLIFGSVIGNRIGLVHGVSYPLFIAPGLILMSVITNAYSNTSTSLFSCRFQKSIEEMLISPMHYGFILLGFVLGGTLRGVLVAIFVYFVCIFFVPLTLGHLVKALPIIVLVSLLFSLAGFTNGMLAKNFDDIAIVPTFILGPLTYLGGVFYTTSMLTPFWQKLMYVNPIFYMVNSVRDVLVGQHEINLYVSVSLIAALVIILLGLNLTLLKKGTGIRD